MTQQNREKYWQEKAGRLASIANWALVELLATIHGHGDTDADDQAEDYLEELRYAGALEFDEEE